MIDYYTLEKHQKLEQLLLQNFDAKKKYPMILYFYEKYTNELYTYRAPAPSASTINIPLFVSNGYLVFVPDIHYKKGEPGESAYNSVVSAAKYFAPYETHNASE